MNRGPVCSLHRLLGSKRYLIHIGRHVTLLDHSLSVSQVQGSISRRSEEFSHLENRSKISNIMSTQLSYSNSDSLNINSGFLHTRSLRRPHSSVFRYRPTKDGCGQKGFRGFQEKGPWTLIKI